MIKMIVEQIEQIDKGFKFAIDGEEVVVTYADEKKVSICKVSNFQKIESFPSKESVAKYLENTDQSNLLDLNVISAGQFLVDTFKFKKVNGLYEVSGTHFTHKGGVAPMTLIEIGQIALKSVSEKTFNIWLQTLKK
jgi:hypothetical protein